MRLRYKILAFFVFFCLLVSSFVCWALPKYSFPIMMYHSINHEQHLLASTVSPEVFEKQIVFLKKYGYKVLTVDEYVHAVKNKKRFLFRRAVITLDDAYVDNYTYALEILKKYKIPVILFVPSDLVGKKGYLSWQQLKEMQNNGVTIGSHTRNHIYLPHVPPEVQKDEIFESKRILEENLGVKVDYFAYPVGGFSEDIKKLVKEAGYKAAFTTNRGFNRTSQDLYSLKRIKLSNENTSFWMLFGKLSGFYDIFREIQEPSLIE